MIALFARTVLKHVRTYKRVSTFVTAFVVAATVIASVVIWRAQAHKSEAQADNKTAGTQSPAAPSAPLAAFTPGNLVIYRVDGGGAALNANGTAVFLDEYTPAGALVQSIAVPTTTVASNRRLTASGSANSEGLLTRSVDGRYLVFAGYDAALGTVGVATSTSAAVNRVIGRADSTGAIDTTTALTDASTGSNPRGAASTNGSDLWETGGAGGSRYFTFGVTTSTQLSVTVTNLRATNIFGGQLYVSSASGAFRLATVGTGTPTTAGQTITNLPGFPTTGSPYGFFFADLNAGVAGVDTVYVADDAGTIQKYSLVSGNWAANGTIALPNVRGVTGVVSGTTVTLYVTNAGAGTNTLQRLIDSSGYNATITGTLSSLAPAAANTAFRGVALAPEVITVNPSFLFTGTFGATYNFPISASGGVAPYTFSVTSGTVPTGLTLNSDGTWSGTPTAIGTFNFTVTATDAGGVTGSRAYTLTINPVLNVAADVTVTEGNSGTTPATFTVTLTPADPTNTVTVQYFTSDGTAKVADNDYVAIPNVPANTLTFLPNQTSKTVDVLVNGDTNIEPNEQFFFNISTPTNANISFNQRSGFITNDDALLNVTTDPTVTEGNSGTTPATFTVTLTPAVPQTVTVHYSTQDNSATVADNDYTAIPDTLLTFNPFETTKSINVLVKGDTNFEPTEQFFFNINNPLGANISDNQGIGTITNDDAAPETTVAVTGGNLILTDSNGGTTADTLTFSNNAGNLRISDPNNTLSAGAGATQVDANTVDIPLASITGNIQVNTLGGNDTLTLNLSSGDFIPAGGLTFNGGTQTSTPGDKLVITGGSQGTVTYNYTNANDGSVVMSAFGTVTYTGLEPLTNSGSATDLIFNLPAGPTAATLADDGTGGNTMSRLSGATFEATDFANPTGSLTINRGNAADTLAVNALPDFNASLTIGSGANPFSTITFGGAVTLASGKSLTGDATGQINLSTATADLATSGSGAVSLTTASNINLVVGSSISVVNGNLALHANQQVAPTVGIFRGIFVNGGALSTSGTGNIDLQGKGGTDAGTPTHMGISINNGGTVNSTSGLAGAGTITFLGAGAAGSTSNRGVEVSLPGSLVTSVRGDILFTGTGGTGGPNNYGISILNGGVVSSTGAAKITFNGTGGSGTSGSTGSRIVGDDTKVTSAGGDISVTGFGGSGTSNAHHGVSIAIGALVSATNGARIIVNGTAGSGSTSNTGIVLAQFGIVSLVPTKITSDSGDIQFTGQGGSGGIGNIGWNIDTTATVVATGSANISITGTGGSGTSDCYGIGFEAANAIGTGVSAVNGNITLTGTGGPSAGTDMDGVRFEDSVVGSPQPVLVTTTGTGTLTITGTAGNADPTSAGINIVDYCTMTLSAAATFIADTMDIGTSNVSINAGANAITLRQKTSGLAINLGGADSATQLGLTNPEVDRFSAGTLNFGDVNSGAITVSATIIRTSATALNLFSGANIDFTTGLLNSNGGNVNLNPGTNVFPASSGSDVSTSGVTTLKIASGKALKIVINNATPDTGYTQLGVAGLVDISGVTLALSGAHVPVVSQMFTIVDNDASDAITGTFAGLPEGALIPNFLGSGSNAQISYIGGTGNDVVLTVISAPTAAVARISGQIFDPNGRPVSGATVTITVGGGPRLIRTITDMNGFYKVENLEVGGFYTVTPSRANYVFAPANRAFSLVADRTDAVFTGTGVSADSNPLESPEFFVRQQYMDFLNREPDQGGLDYWSAQLRACGPDLNCLKTQKIGVSAAFFMSEEFELSGAYIYRLYRAALGRQLTHAEFTDDHKKVIGGADLESLRTQFADAFVERPEFIAKYQSAVLAETFVEAMLQGMLADAQVDLSSQRAALIAAYNSGSDMNHSRSAVLRAVAERTEFKAKVYNSSFVLMEYFGYLQRDMDQEGFDFWVNVLGGRDPGNYRGMVCSFTTSAEYQRRFSPMVIHSNAECGN